MQSDEHLFKATYEIEKSSSLAMSWDDYHKIIQSEWGDLLSKSNEKNESEFQAFFERHPCMLPRVYDVFGGGAHGVWPSALISQPVLPSFDYKKPDFMWIASDSATVYAVLIELEASSKPLTRKDGQQHSLFTQALKQLKDWKSWFADPVNMVKFKEYYQIPDELYRERTFKQRYILIYGRRADALSNKSFARTRAFINSEDETIMSYDRLAPNWILKDCLCVRINEKGYHAISIPPTLKLGPAFTRDWSVIKNKEKAVSSCKYLPADRKEFLIRRWTYWDHWAKNCEMGWVSSQDSE